MSISADRPAGARPALLDAFGRPYEPAVSPRLKVLLFLVFLATALLGLSGVYLLAIDVLEWCRGQTYVNQFYLWMFLAHVAVGVVIALPFLFFGISHYLSARHRKNRRAVRLGVGLFLSGILVVLTGLALVQLEGLPQLPTGSITRWVVWGLHVLVPGLAVFLYIQHRRAGPDIQWRYGYGWGVAVAGVLRRGVSLPPHPPRQLGGVGRP